MIDGEYTSIKDLVDAHMGHIASDMRKMEKTTQAIETKLDRTISTLNEKGCHYGRLNQQKIKTTVRQSGLIGFVLGSVSMLSPKFGEWLGKFL